MLWGKKILMIFNNCYKLYELQVLYLLIEKNNKKYEQCMKQKENLYF